jgi:hypothetical protein
MEHKDKYRQDLGDYIIKEKKIAKVSYPAMNKRSTLYRVCEVLWQNAGKKSLCSRPWESNFALSSKVSSLLLMQNLPTLSH